MRQDNAFKKSGPTVGSGMPASHPCCGLPKIPNRISTTKKTNVGPEALDHLPLQPIFIHIKACLLANQSSVQFSED